MVCEWCAITVNFSGVILDYRLQLTGNAEANAKAAAARIRTI
jgi:hypothetical protein